MNTSDRGKALVALAFVGLMTATACSPTGQNSTAPEGAAPAAPTPTSTQLPVPDDVLPWLTPTHKYFGATFNGVPQSLAPVTNFAGEVGKHPNLLAFYLAWGSQLSISETMNIWHNGMVPYIAWEPFDRSLAQIASGIDDTYITEFATEVRRLQVPIAISFGHEMNGDWYPWGTKTTTPSQFVRAWQLIHNIFQNQVGATNAIWVWDPNVINPVPKVALAPYYPGDQYVDWVGVTGYYATYGPHTFDTLFGPTMDQIRTFTQKPFFISETASEPGARRPEDIADLFDGVADHPDVLGFIWFDIPKDANWQIDGNPAALAAFRTAVSNPLFGFDVRQP